MGSSGFIAEHVRMAANQFFTDRRCHISKPEFALLAGHLRVKNHLEKQVAQLIFQIMHVHAFDRVGDFIGFLDGVG